MNGSLEFDKSIKGTEKNLSPKSKAGFSKVKDLLRESKGTSFNIKGEELDRMFNLEMPDTNSQDKISKDYISKIVKLRNL